jgi:hypothetical protein
MRAYNIIEKVRSIGMTGFYPVRGKITTLKPIGMTGFFADPLV